MHKAEQNAATTRLDKASLGASRPATLRYRALVEGLAKMADGVDEEGVPAAPLLVFTAQVQVVLAFLQPDPAIGSETLRPLRMGHAALHDKVNGGTVDWLDRPPRPSNVTKPKYVYWHLVRGSLVMALQRLIDAKMPRTAASTWLERKIARAGIKNPPVKDGKPASTRITAAQLLRWRDRGSDGKAPELQRWTVEDLRQEYPRKPRSLEQAQADAEALVERARLHVFSDTPPHSA